MLSFKKNTLFIGVFVVMFSEYSFAKYSYNVENKTVQVQEKNNSFVEDARNTDDNIIEQMNRHGIDSSETNEEINLPGKRRNIIGYDEAFLEQQKRFEYQSDKKEYPNIASKNKKFAFDIEEYARKMEENNTNSKIPIIFNPHKKKIRFARGYCYLNHDVMVNRVATYVYVDCDFEAPLKQATLAFSAVPEFYAKAVIGNPLYVTNLSSNDRLVVKRGIVMTKDRNSINIADIMNDYLVEKIVATSTYKGLDVLAKQAQAYLTAKDQARYSQSSVVAGGLNPVVTQNSTVRPPRIEDYIATATVQMVSEIANIVGENFVENLPYSFKINKGKVFYVDLEFETEEGVVGYGINQENIIKKSPKFTDKFIYPPKEDAIPVFYNKTQKSNTERKKQ